MIVYYVPGSGLRAAVTSQKWDGITLGRLRIQTSVSPLSTKLQVQWVLTGI